MRLDWVEKWFSAWELTSKEVLSLPQDTPPEMLFFDEKYIYTTSKVSAPNGSLLNGPKLFEKKLPWRMAPHNGQITLPDGQEIPVGLMTFAAPAGKEKVFFVMAAPSYWKKAGIGSEQLNLEKMLTGVFLHEFAHTRQFKGIGSQIDSIERHYQFEDIKLSDDIVQEHFEKDSAYVKIFNSEVNKFYEAVFADNDEDSKLLAMEAIALLKSRQTKYFTKDKAILEKLDNIFLSMEGLGQFVAVAWLIHPGGGNVTFDVAVNGFRRNRKRWSQEEGLAMFLLLNKLTTPNWVKDIFGEEPKYITNLLEQAAKNQDNK